MLAREGGARATAPERGPGQVDHRPVRGAAAPRHCPHSSGPAPPAPRERPVPDHGPGTPSAVPALRDAASGASASTRSGDHRSSVSSMPATLRAPSDSRPRTHSGLRFPRCRTDCQWGGAGWIPRGSSGAPARFEHGLCPPWPRTRLVGGNHDRTGPSAARRGRLRAGADGTRGGRRPPAPGPLEPLALGGRHLPAGRRAARRHRDHPQVRRAAPDRRGRRHHLGHRPRAAPARGAGHRQDLDVGASGGGGQRRLHPARPGHRGHP